MRRAIICSFVAVAWLIVSSVPAQGVDPAAKCEAGKLKQSGKYAACRLKAEAKALKKGGDADFGKCDARLDKKWSKIEGKAEGACPVTGDVEPTRDALTAKTTAVAEWIAASDETTATDGERKCAAVKIVVAGKHANCVLKTAAKVAQGRASLAAFDDCGPKSEKKWTKIEAKYAADCSVAASASAFGKVSGEETSAVLGRSARSLSNLSPWRVIQDWLDELRASVLSLWSAIAGAVCGDGTVAAGEYCDDGNTTDGDGCDRNCRPTGCGNGIVTAGEECDDGNVANGDGCDAACLVEATCGNGVVTGGEECDDGNTDDNDACVGCRWARCGDGALCDGSECRWPAASPYISELLNRWFSLGELCDDGNFVSGDGCDSNCLPTGCGNGIKTAGEQCDDFGDSLECDRDCTFVACGDGYANGATYNGVGEQCDPPASQGGRVGCDDSCQATCVDGSTEMPGLRVTEHQITASPAWETAPRLGNDGVSDLVVFTSRVGDPANTRDLADIWYQRLTGDGSPSGPAIQVSTGTTNDELNDTDGDYIVYVAYDSIYSRTGAIVVHQLSTGTDVFVHETDAPYVTGPHIYGDRLVWSEGILGAVRLMMYDLSWLGTPQDAITLAGPDPRVMEVNIGDRYVVWTQYEPGDAGIVAYDLTTEAIVDVTNSLDVIERQPITSGDWVAWLTIDPTSLPLHWGIAARNLETNETRTIVDGPWVVHRPSIDGDLITYEVAPNGYGDFDVRVYRISTGETFPVVADAGTQFINDVSGDLVAYVDGCSGDDDVYVAKLSWSWCGDGTIEPAFGEECDPPNAQGGAPGCDGSCLDHCGDGVIDSDLGEQCDGSNLGGETCASLGFPPGGTLACSSSCKYATVGCTSCSSPCDCPSGIGCHNGQCGYCTSHAECCGVLLCINGVCLAY